MFDVNTKKAAALLVGFLAAAPAIAYESGGGINMTRGVTPVSHAVYAVHMQIFWVCVAIAVVVFGAMIYSLVAFRKSSGAVPDKSLTHSTKVEIVWTVIPVLILVFMAVPAAKTTAAPKAPVAKAKAAKPAATPKKTYVAPSRRALNQHAAKLKAARKAAAAPAAPAAAEAPKA